MHKKRGFTLVEVLVALVVLTVGMLGVSVLYVQGLRMNRTSIYRTLAVGLTADMADRIRSNSSVPNSYAGAGPGTDNGCVNGLAICAPADQAADDWFRWFNDVRANLPAGVQAEILVTADGAMNLYEISLTWPEIGHVDPDTGNPVPASYTLPIKL